MNDRELFAKAMATAGYSSTSRFAVAVLGVDPRLARRWVEGERELQSTVRLVCAAIIANPDITHELEMARWSLSGLPEPLHISQSGEDFVAQVKPEFGNAAALRAPWCVSVNGAWYEVGEFNQEFGSRDVPDEAVRFIRSIGKERGPAWLATPETPLLLRIDGETVRGMCRGPTRYELTQWVFEWEGSASGGGAADPDQTLGDAEQLARTWLAARHAEADGAISRSSVDPV